MSKINWWPRAYLHVIYNLVGLASNSIEGGFFSSAPEDQRLSWLIDEASTYTDGRIACTTRIAVKKNDFAKVIGRGGSNINQIKAKSGATVKGTEIDVDERYLNILKNIVKFYSFFKIASK